MKRLFLFSTLFLPMVLLAQLPPANYGDIIISEVMADPVGLVELPETEYVEIHNTTNDPVLLKGWSFIYLISSSSSTTVMLPDTTLMAGGYAILYRAGREIQVDSGGIELPTANFPNNLANTGRSLLIQDSSGIIIDSTAYAAAKPAQAWERNTDGTWYLSTDPKGGTPGAVNSPKEAEPPPENPESPDYSQPGDVIINEVMADPVGLIELPETEYVEIHNTTNNPVSLKGWSFIYLISSSSSTTVMLPDTTLVAGGYAILYRAGREIQVDPGGIKLPIANFPTNLANTGRSLLLKNSSGTIIDSTVYAAARAAQAWERDTDGTWYLSTDPKGGTPGAVNSPKEATEQPPIANPNDHSQPGNVIINEVMANPVGLTELPETEYVEIYNTSDTDISLSGWSFIYDGRVSAFPEVVLPVDGYAVLYRAEREIVVGSTGIAIAVSGFPANLANTGRTIGIVNSHGVTIDTVSYAAARAAQAWERDADDTWYLSTDPKGGTPGAVNSPKEATEQPPIANPNDHSQPGNVIINEVMANPVGLTELPETEYVEIYNTSDTDISLSGWSFIYDGRVSAFPEVVLPVDGYAVLYRAEREIVVGSTGIAIAVSGFPANLANTGRTIGIVNSHGVTIDTVSYAAARAAQAWERDADDTWYLSTDPKGGTPGAINSPKEETESPPIANPSDYSQPGDVIINEVMANPVGLTELPETEYVEIYNTSDTDISLSGWSFIYDGRVSAFPEVVLPVDGYAVLYRAEREIVVGSTGIAIAVSGFPANLANTGRTIGIVNSHGVTIDTVSYAAARAAQAWERDADDTWYLSTDPKGGTPGAINSPKEETEPPPIANPSDYSQPGDVIINEVMANPVGLTELPETEYVEIYNTSDTDISLSGWSFIYDGRVSAFPEVVLPIDGYAVLYRAEREIVVRSTGIAIAISGFPANLANTGRTIGIVNSHGITIDTVSYAAARAAQAWERDADDTWYLSTDPKGGTPGAVNSPKEATEQPPIANPNDHSQPGDVIINEVMANPVGLTELPETEYVEIYNTSDTDISLSGWSFVYDGRVSAFPEVVLPIDGYTVLYRAEREIVVGSTGIAVAISGFPANLANTGRTIGIVNSHGITIDTVNYAAARAARAWERDADNTWYLSTDPKGGTPGAANSPKEATEQPPIDSDSPTDFLVKEQELIFNELLPDPFAGGSEYIELYNRSDRAISLANISIATRRADGTLYTRYPLASITDLIHPGEYIVLSTSKEGVLDFYHTPNPSRVYALRLPILNNTGATLALFRTHDEFVIDQVSYSSNWHNGAIKNTKGVALERIHPDKDTQDATNWASATAMVGYGTPGYKNAQQSITEEESENFLHAPEYDPISNEYIIMYQTNQPGYQCRMEVFTIEGRKVGVISNNQLIGTIGEIRWSGEGLDGSRLHTGIYVFYAELYHPDGHKKTYKKVFLIKDWP